MRVSDGSILTWTTLGGIWGIPAPTVSPTGGEGVTRDGKKVVVASVGGGWPTRFAVLDARSMRTLDRFDLDGSFAYDAMSPDASTLYLVQHVGSGERRPLRRARVRHDEPSPAAGPDRGQDAAGWVMEGSPVSRATSGDGRWVYTMYQRPGGYPFVHALDTVTGVAHCIGLPWKGDQARAREHRAHACRRRQDARHALARRQVVADDEHGDVAAHARRCRHGVPVALGRRGRGRCAPCSRLRRLALLASPPQAEGGRAVPL